MIHGLKTHLKPFEAILEGTKKYEVRKADRDFKVGDILFLQEYDEYLKECTGKHKKVEITYITEAGTWGLPKDLCVLGFKVLDWWNING